MDEIICKNLRYLPAGRQGLAGILRFKK